MRIAQVVPAMWMGDAVGNNCRAINNILLEAGYDSEIYAEMIDERLPKNEVRPMSTLKKLGDNDVFLYHLATAFGRDLTQYGGMRVFQYHNMTPPAFFEGYSPEIVNACNTSLQEARSMRGVPDLCWADSEFNKQDLLAMDYTCPIHVTPILVPFDDYRKPADPEVVRRYDDDYVNFLFVGRVVPNKAFEDVIRTFAWYQRHINSKCRLFLVGNTSLEVYVNRLKRYIRLLDVQNVIFPGHISFNAILAYYRVADVFLCMSQHEGFCVPLLEAMFFHIPIIARSIAAIPYTLGDAGILMPDNDPVAAAMMVDRIVTDKPFRERLIASQDRRLQYFSTENIKNIILKEIAALA